VPTCTRATVLAAAELASYDEIKLHLSSSFSIFRLGSYWEWDGMRYDVGLCFLVGGKREKKRVT